MERVEETNVPAPAAVRPPLGASCDVDDCKDPARFTYSWDWGESGICCATHQVVLQQKAATLKRNVVFAALDPGAEAPMQRSERAQLKGEVYAVEAELTETKERNAQLYQQNRGLAGQVQALTVRQNEADAQLRDLRIELQKQGEAADRYRTENANMVEELTRLRLLVNTEDTQPGAGATRLGPGELPPGSVPE